MDKMIQVSQLVGNKKTGEAGLLGFVNRVTIWRWVKAGKFPAPVKVGGLIFWRESDLQRWQDEQRVEPIE